MNLEEAHQKIRLYRKINEQNRSFRHKDYNNFYELYPKNELESVKDILAEYEEKKVADIINPKNEFFKFYGANYTDKCLVKRTETSYKLHFEFNDALFYELLHFFKEDIEKFTELLANELSIYSTSNTSYNIPYNIYQKFFTHLNDEGIKEAIRFLNKTVTFTIVSDYDYISTNIYVDRINNYLTYSARYNQ